MFHEDHLFCDIRRGLYLWIYLTAKKSAIIPATPLDALPCRVMDTKGSPCPSGFIRGGYVVYPKKENGDGSQLSRDQQREGTCINTGTLHFLC